MPDYFFCWSGCRAACAVYCDINTSDVVFCHATCYWKCYTVLKQLSNSHNTEKNIVLLVSYSGTVIIMHDKLTWAQLFLGRPW